MNPSSERINFVITQVDLWPELFDLENIEQLEPIPDERLGSVEICWIAQTYIKLKLKGYNVTLKDHFVRGEICVVSAGELFSQMAVVECSYVVAIRGDCSRTFISHYTVTQNMYGCKYGNDYFIPHWPQPDITPRRVSRGAQISCIAFKGARLPSDFKSSSFRSELAELGVTLQLEEKSNSGYDWRDYSEVDLVLAVRDFYGVTKPASKLVNAWLARVPALLGPEPAFRELKNDDLDYLEVLSESDVIQKVKWLIANPAIYQSMRDRCEERSQDYTEERYIEIWVSFLFGEVQQGYLAWSKCSPRRKKFMYHTKLTMQHLQWKKETVGIRLLSVFKKGRYHIEAFFLR